MAEVQLRRLEAEPWGARLGRARKAAELNVREVEEILFPHISKSALIRLETFQEVPTARKDRGRAALVLLLYGFELEPFGLTQADIPPAMDYRALGRLRAAMQRKRGLSCSPIWGEVLASAA